MNIKKLISAFLALMMIFSAFSVFAEETADVPMEEEIVEEIYDSENFDDSLLATDEEEVDPDAIVENPPVDEPVSVPEQEENFVKLSSGEFKALVAMGMLDADFMALSDDSTISRAQFIGALSRIAGFDTVDYKAKEIPFIDVNSETLHKNEICFFYEAGYINGTSINTFSPYETITYNQAVKIILDVCGYRDLVAAKYGQGLMAYNAMSVYLDLSDGITIGNADAPLTAKKAVKLLFNAGRCPVIEPSHYTKNEIIYTTGDREELFNIRNDIYYGTGVLKSNGLVSLLTENVSDTYAVIDTTQYLLPETDLASLIGCHVEFFYKNDGSVKKLLWAGESDKNNALVLESENLLVNDSRYDMDTIVYKNGKKSALALLSPYADIVYNNALYNDATIAHLKPVMGTIRLLDNNMDNLYDLVVVEEYQNCVVKGKLESYSYITGKYGNTIPVADYENVIIYVDGIEATFDDIKINTIVSFVADRNKNHLILYVTGSQGKSKLVSYGENNGEVTYEFEEGTYTLSPSYRDLDETRYSKVNPIPGRTYNYYFDKKGNIAEIVGVEDGIIDYALLVKAQPDSDWKGSTNKAVVRLLLRNGTFTNCKTREKFTLNGVKNKVGTDLLNQPGLFDEEGLTKEQIVRVAFNEDGEITQFEFAIENRLSENPSANPYGYDSENFSLDYSTAGGISTVDGILRDGKYVVDSGCFAFVKYLGTTDSDPYAVSNMNSVGPGASNRYYYDINAGQELTIGYAEVNSSGTQLTGQLLVSKVMYKNVDGESVKTIAGYYDAGYVEYPELYEGTIPDGIKRGDVLNIALYKNKLVTVEKFISLADRPRPMGSYTPSSFQMFGYVYSASNKSLNILISDNISAEAKYGKVAPVNFYRVGNTNVMIYDVGEDIMYRGSVQDLQTSTYPEKDGSITFDGNELLAVCKGNGYRNYGMIFVKY